MSVLTLPPTRIRAFIVNKIRSECKEQKEKESDQVFLLTIYINQEKRVSPNKG